MKMIPKQSKKPREHTAPRTANAKRKENPLGEKVNGVSVYTAVYKVNRSDELLEFLLRKCNTSRNNVAPQSTPSRNNTGVQKPQGPKPKQNAQVTSGSRSKNTATNGSRSNVKQSQPKQTQSSGTSRSSSNRSSSSSGSRSTGSRGR